MPDIQGLPSSTTLPTSLVEEEAVALEINGITYAVMMLTPHDLEDFAVGFLITEHIIKQAIDIHDIEQVIDQSPQQEMLVKGIILQITLANRSEHEFKDRLRLVKGTSGCGICGSVSLQHAFKTFPPLTHSTNFPLNVLSDMRSKAREFQRRSRLSGAMHGAFLLSPEGSILLCREDIGRHNALDKLIGKITTETMDTCDHAILMTSRCSAELVQKVYAAKLSVLISFASPSDLALRIARHYNITLIHIPRKDAPKVYRPMLEYGQISSFETGSTGNE